MSENLVSIGRGQTVVKLFDTAGAEVKMYTSLTADQTIQLQAAYADDNDTEKMVERAFKIVEMCFIDWNIGKDGAKLPCNSETLRQLTQRDVLALTQACTGRKLLDDDGNLLTPEEIAKKGKSA